MTLDFIAVSSYGAATKSSGEVRLLKDLDTPLQARDVIIVEDIVDTGLTLHYLQDVLRARDPKSLRTACLLSKPSRRKVDVVVEYIGFEIEDKFVVGYGGPEIDIALMRGEVDARANALETLTQRNADWLQQGLLQLHALVEVPKGQRPGGFAHVPEVEVFARQAKLPQKFIQGGVSSTGEMVRMPIGKRDRRS